ncbi:MAG: cysteine hydrolase [Limnohabitans sp.]|jgi:nicotinamidase-related amidase|uniref:cysteine hydrolase family protein n=1 Tax=Limnohabitans sp. TaxID=1907725 RepID=UPI001B4BD21F|nr:cysteine hydrolase [Limnohabitans sp.]MBP6220655.1 cysteine hydrolase [Limnohabitans sp.]MBP6245069.1 cysteine hydrolase [Limnohabitans sp.]
MNLQNAKLGMVIVDLQNDFLAPDGAYARGNTLSAEAVKLPERMAPVARAIKGRGEGRGGLVTASLFTLWPDAQGEPMISAHLKERRPFLRKGDFAPGSRGQANVDLLAPLVDVSVFKVAYSAFFNTQLDWVLKKSGIDTLVVCGIVTNGGVASTVRDAHVRDYHVIVLSDGCAAFSEAAHQAALADMASVAEVMDSAAFLKQLG